MFVVYESYDEILVFTLENEAARLKEYFEEADRDMDNYDRIETDILQVNARMSTRTD